MSVSALSSTFSGFGAQNETKGPVSGSTMDFYQLLTTQLTNQNPLEPVKETDFLGQMAQFSTVEQLQSLGRGMSRSQSEQRWLDAQDYLGRRIQWASADGTERAGEVARIDRDAEGEIWLEVDGQQVALDQVVAVAPGSSTPPRPPIGDDIR